MAKANRPPGAFAPAEKIWEPALFFSPDVIYCEQKASIACVLFHIEKNRRKRKSVCGDVVGANGRLRFAQAWLEA